MKPVMNIQLNIGVFADRFKITTDVAIGRERHFMIIKYGPFTGFDVLLDYTLVVVLKNFIDNEFA